MKADKPSVELTLGDGDGDDPEQVEVAEFNFSRKGGDITPLGNNRAVPGEDKEYQFSCTLTLDTKPVTCLNCGSVNHVPDTELFGYMFGAGAVHKARTCWDCGDAIPEP